MLSWALASTLCAQSPPPFSLPRIRRRTAKGCYVAAITHPGDSQDPFWLRQLTLDAARAACFSSPGQIAGQSASQDEKSSAQEGSPGHILWVVPAFRVDYLKNIQPLTPRQKFSEWARSAYDPLGFIGAGIESAAEYSPRNGFCGYGRGLLNYGECFGSAELDGDLSGFFGNFLFDVIMHQDPRYFALGHGPTSQRIRYAVSRVFITRTDSGETAVNYSALAGTVLAAAASNLYYPRQNRGVELSVTRVGWALGNTAAFNLAAEFWPAIRRTADRIF